MGPGKNRVGAMIACGKVCLGVMSTSSRISCGKSPSALFDETPQEGILRQGGSFWRR